MKILTFTTAHDPTPRVGVLEDSQVVDVSPFLEEHAALTDPTTTILLLLNASTDLRTAITGWVAKILGNGGGIAESSVIYLPALLNPGKFLCVGKNNKRHLVELRERQLLTEQPSEPTGFITVNAALSGHRAKVARPTDISTLDYEPELAFVIAQTAHGTSEDEAMGCVGAITLFNDLTAREVQQREVAAGTRFWTAKNMPGFAPLGPVLIPLDEIGDPHALTLICRVNGEERLRFQPSEQIYGISEVIAHFSRYVPLLPGDVMSLGAPAGTAIGQSDPSAFYLEPGDVVDVHCAEIGTLTTHIVAP